MRSSLLPGLVLAVLVGLLAVVGGPLSLESMWPLLLAAAVAFVPLGGLPGRLVAFVAGMAAGWVAFVLRAGVLPDIPMGRAIFVMAPVVIVTLVAFASAGRAPLWAGLSGLVAFGAAYHPVFAASPTDFVAQSVATMTSVLLAAAVGAAAAMLLRPAPPADPGSTEHVSSTAPLVPGSKEVSA